MEDSAEAGLRSVAGRKKAQAREGKVPASSLFPRREDLGLHGRKRHRRRSEVASGFPKFLLGFCLEVRGSSFRAART